MNSPQRSTSFITGLQQRLARVTSGGRYLPAIDGLRFVAILLVVIQHLNERVIRYAPASVGAAAENDVFSFLAGRGTVGVFLFFAISGFILGLPFARRRREQQAGLPLKQYFLRRLTRLEPPYIFWMIVFALALIFLRGDNPGEVVRHLGASLIYSHGWIFGTYSTINPVAWSLEVEVQFYLLAPLLARFFFSGSDVGMRRFRLAAVIVFSLMAQHLFGWKVMPWKASLLGQLPHFLLGFLLADLYLDGKLRPLDRNAWRWDVAGILALFAMLFSWSEELLKELVFSAALFVFFTAALRGSWLRAFLSRPWIAVAGGMCYTIYLIHLPLLELIVPRTAGWLVPGGYGIQLAWQLLLVTPLIFLFSAGAFLLFEKPFMDPRWVTRWSSRRSRTALIFYFTKTSPMRFLRFIPWLVLIAMLFALKARAQPGVGDFPADLQNVYDDPGSVLLLQLQPLPALVDAALANSPVLKIQDYQIENRAHSVDMSRRSWTKNISFGGNVSRGNGQFLDVVQTIQDNTIQETNRSNTIFNVGFSLKIPLSDLTVRPSAVKVAANEVRIAILEKEQLEEEIRRKVVEHYHQLTLRLRILKIKAESLEFHRVAAGMAEKYFREGAIDIDQFTQTVAKKTAAEEEFETARSEALLAFMLLREQVGADISLLSGSKSSGQ